MTVKRPAPEEIDELRDLYSTKWISNAELKRIERDTGRPFKRGRFTKQEIDMCTAAVEEYILAKHLNREEFIDLMFVRNNEKNALLEREEDSFRDFFVNVARKLDGRPVVNVYHFLRRRLHPKNTGEAWSLEMDDELKRLHLLYGPQWERIGREMGKFHVSCRDRYRKIQLDYKRGAWSEEEIQRLEEAYQTVENGKKPGNFATWNFISDSVGTRSANQCQWKWTETITFRHLHPDKQRVVWSQREDRCLVTMIFDLGIEHQSEISFSSLCSSGRSLERFTPGRVRHRWAQLKKRVRNADNLPVDDVCEFLMRELAPLSPEMVSSSTMRSDLPKTQPSSQADKPSSSSLGSDLEPLKQLSKEFISDTEEE